MVAIDTTRRRGGGSKYGGKGYYKIGEIVWSARDIIKEEECYGGKGILQDGRDSMVARDTTRREG